MVHIGNLILQKLQETGKKPAWLAGQMNRHRSYVKRILESSSIQTNDLMIVSKIVEFNFFECLYIETEEYLSKK